MKKVSIEMEFETKFKGKLLTVLCNVTNPVIGSGAFTHAFGVYDPNGPELDQVDFESVHVWSRRRNEYVPVTGDLEQILTERIWDENFSRIEAAVFDAA